MSKLTLTHNSIPATFCPETMTVLVNDVPVKQGETIAVLGYDEGKLVATSLMLAGYKVDNKTADLNTLL